MAEFIENEVYLQMLGVRIQELRKDRKLTQTDLAEKIGATKMQIIRIERGKTNSTINMLRSIAKVLDVRIDELVLIE